ncbi:MAG: UbiD family decarboxylase [Bacteroidota bacterium]
MAPFHALGDFLRYLESQGELKRVRVEVDPYLEITEIATRAVHENMPALLFENVRGSAFPLAANVYASEKRIELALGRHPQEIGLDLIDFAERLMPPRAQQIWKKRGTLLRALSAIPRRTARPLSQEVVSSCSLDDLPVQTCWPGDGGKFITLGQVITYDPVDGKRNVGIYRMQVYDAMTAGMHWQIQKGGGFHYWKSEAIGRDLEVAVALGTDPALLLASVAALPEGIDEALFAGFLRGRALRFARGKTVSIPVPAGAEFVLEGIVPQRERRKEGPFGDHFGHYSHAAPFPVFHARAITHRKNPVYPATVVGIPPMEDKFIGDATQQILGPLARVLHKEVRDLWAYYEAGFHNLLVVSVEERYHKEAMKAALGLLGTGQLSLTKCVVLVSETVDPRNWKSVLKAVKEYFDPHFDFLLLPKVPLDTLDFTSFTMELGSKMIVDATAKRRIQQKGRGLHLPEPRKIKSLDRRITDVAVMEETLVLVKTAGEGRGLMQSLVRRKDLEGAAIVAIVSDDVDIHDQENALWGLFTRFDCERDILFAEQKMIGISPVYKGVMGIDATWKTGYPKALKMDKRIVKNVENRWHEYWI